MSLFPLNIPPGVVRDGTDYASAGRWYAADKVRFRNEQVETIGGWTKYSDTQMTGVPRHSKAWKGLVGERIFAVGTNSKFYIWIESDAYDVTPIRRTVTLGADPFSFTNGSPTITVTDASHDAVLGDFVTFSGATAAAGLTIDGEYEIQSIVDTNTYTITAGGNANATTTGGGAAVEAAYQINVGLADYISGIGWGAGPWGRGGWGSGYDIATVSDQVRTWTSGNFEQDLIFCPRGDGIFVWDYSSPFDRATYVSDAVGASDVPEECNGIIIADQERRVIGWGVTPTGGGAKDPMLIRWSTDGDYAFWDPTDTTETAGGVALDDGREIITILSGSREFLIFTDTALYAMQYNQSRTVFDVERIGASDIAGPMAATNLYTATYWMGKNNFYMYNGQINVLPCTLQDYVFSDVNISQSFKFFAVTNTLYNEIWFFYCSDESDEIDRYVIFRTDGVWTPGTLSRTTGVDVGIVTAPRYCDADGYVYNHETGTNDGSVDPPVSLEPYIESGPIEIDGGNDFYLIRRIIPDLSFRKSTNPTPIVNVGFTAQDEPGSDGTAGPTVEVVCAGPTETGTHSRIKGIRLRGRACLIRFSSDQTDTAWRLGITRVDAVKLGRK